MVGLLSEGMHWVVFRASSPVPSVSHSHVYILLIDGLEYMAHYGGFMLAYWRQLVDRSSIYKWVCVYVYIYVFGLWTTSYAYIDEHAKDGWVSTYQAIFNPLINGIFGTIENLLE